MDENTSVPELTNLRVFGEENVGKLYEAIGRASAAFQPVPKNQAGQYGNQKFSYAPYHVLRKCILPSLTANGVSIMQPLHREGNRVASTLIVAGHGAAISSTVTFDLNHESIDRFTKEKKFDVQLFGKDHTYWRRYQLQAFFCLEGDADAADPDDIAPPKPENRDAESAAARPDSNGSKAKDQSSPANVQPAKRADDAPVDDKGGSEKPTGNGSVDAQKQPVKSGDARTLNDKLLEAMKQLKWTMKDLDAFARENIESFPGFVQATKMTDNQKLTMWNLLVESKGVVPF
jgi:hypothetical protein